MRVVHKTYGRGEVVGKRMNGYELEVQFESGRRLWVKRAQLIEDEPAEVSFAEVSFSKPLPTLSMQDIVKKQRVKARCIIEALRLGIPPEGQIERLTFGRSAEIERITAWLQESGNAENSVFLIEGNYGVGKTHLLSYMRHQALKLNYAVASVQVDGIETPFYMPKRVYAALASSFAYPKADGSIGDFRRLITEHQALIPTQGPHRPYFFSDMLDNLSNEDWWEWLMGRGGDRPSSPSPHFPERLRDQQNTGNIYSYILSFLGWLAGKAGLRGLLLIFDEAESFDFTSWQRIQKGLGFIRTLILCSRNEEFMLQRPDSFHFEFESHGLDFGSRSSHIPPLYRIPSGLKMLMAFTDLDSIYKKIPALEDMPVQIIKPLTGHQAAQAVDEIARIYDEAYGFALLQDERRSLIDELEDAGDAHNIRYYIKQCVEYMDLARHARRKAAP